MKTMLLKLVAIALLPALGTSCMTTYDAFGNPVRSVDPGAATAIAVGAAAVGFAAGNNRNRHVRHHHFRHGGRPVFHRPVRAVRPVFHRPVRAVGPVGGFCPPPRHW